MSQFLIQAKRVNEQACSVTVIKKNRAGSKLRPDDHVLLLLNLWVASQKLKILSDPI
jgi:hypothetical protein